MNGWASLGLLTCWEQAILASLGLTGLGVGNGRPLSESEGAEQKGGVSTLC